MYLLDKNILSEVMKPQPNLNVLYWLDHKEHLYTSAITKAELLYGAYRMPDGKRKILYLQNINAMMNEEFHQKVLMFDDNCAIHYACLTAQRFAIGKPILMADAQITSIALQYDFTLVTRNIKDFIQIDNLKLINPFLES